MDNLQKARYSRYIYQKGLNEACFQLGRAYGDFEDLARRTASDKILHDKAFNIAKNPKYDQYGCELVSMVYKLLIKSFWWRNWKWQISNK